MLETGPDFVWVRPAWNSVGIFQPQPPDHWLCCCTRLGGCRSTRSVSSHRCCTKSASPSSLCSESELTLAWWHFLPHCYPPTSLLLGDFRPGSVTRQLCSFPSAYSRTDRPMSYRASTKAGGGVGWKYIAVHCPGRPGSSGDHKDPMKPQCSRCWDHQSSKVVSTRFPRSGSEV